MGLKDLHFEQARRERPEYLVLVFVRVLRIETLNPKASVVLFASATVRLGALEAPVEALRSNLSLGG